MQANKKFAIKSVGEVQLHLIEEDKNRPKFANVEEKTYRDFLKWLKSKDIKHDIHSNMITENISVYLVGEGFHDELVAGISLSNHPEKYYIQEAAYKNFSNNRELIPSPSPIKQEDRKVIQTITLNPKPCNIELSLSNDIEPKLLKFVKSDLYKPYHINIQK